MNLNSDVSLREYDVRLMWRSIGALAALLSLAACGQVATPSDVGDRESATDASDDRNVGDSGNPCFPRCLEDLFAMCPASISCVFAGDNQLHTSDSCYTTGVRLHWAQQGAVPIGTVWRADGSLCFTVQPRPDAGPGRFDILDARGVVAAEVTGNDSDLQHLTVACAGSSTVVDRGRDVCRGYIFGSVEPCTPGVCPVR